jgi:hypothetical protein
MKEYSYCSIKEATRNACAKLPPFRDSCYLPFQARDNTPLVAVHSVSAGAAAHARTEVWSDHNGSNLKKGEMMSRSIPMQTPTGAPAVIAVASATAVVAGSSA